jgi:hypothetical protein
MAFIQYLPPSPKAGINEHVSRETAAALIAAGFAQPVPDYKEPVVPDKDDVIVPVDGPVGWSACIYRSPYGADPFAAIVHRDSHGGKTIYNGPPPAQRRWSAEKQAYVMEPSSCPASVVAEYHRIAGNDKEAKIAKERAEREARQAAENSVLVSKGYKPL